jgi:glycosyltransferase involved in cell wall biosynthesis
VDLPTITLITPSFNQARFLGATIRSVLDQHYPHLQYGIVDGGSTDGSIRIIDHYRATLNFVKIGPDAGQSDAINRGFQRASGEVLGWLNSDDLLLPGALQKVGEHFARADSSPWLIGGCREIDQFARPLGSVAAHGQFTLAGALLRPGGFNVPQPSTFWRRELTDRVGLLDPTLHYCMDFDLWCRFLAAGERPDIVDAELSAYRLHPSSKTCARPDRFIAALIDIERRYLHALPPRQRLLLHLLIGYQRRALAVRTSAGRPWKAVLRHPWWLGSQQVLSALVLGPPAIGAATHRLAA